MCIDQFEALTEELQRRRDEVLELKAQMVEHDINQHALAKVTIRLRIFCDKHGFYSLRILITRIFMLICSMYELENMSYRYALERRSLLSSTSCTLA